MAFRYPNTYSFATLQGTNSSRRSLDVDPDNFSTVYLNSRLRPLIWDERDGIRSSTSRARARESRLQSPVLESTSSVSLSVSGIDIRRQDRPLRVPTTGSRPSRSIDEHSSLSAGTEVVREKSDALAFSLAIKELYHQLGTAVAFYIKFDLEYEKDIVQIKKYATREILDNLWAMKIRRSKDLGTAAQDRYHDRYGDNLFAEHEDQFVVWKMKLSRVLDGAITSSFREASHYDCNSTRYQSKVRLIDKIRVANGQLRPLLDMASERRERCRDLITELKMLRGLIDPGRGNSEELPTNVFFNTGMDDRVRAEMDVQDEQEESQYSAGRQW